MRLSDETVASCRAVAAALDPRLEALVALLVCDGLKVTEALALDVDDVSGRAPATTITVRRRGESQRIVLDHDTARAVRRCIGKRRSGPVFVNERSSKSDAPHRLTRFGADHLIRQLRTDDATEQVTANALRRFHINTRQADGDRIDDVRDRAGLANARSVRRYDAAASEESNTDAVDAVHDGVYVDPGLKGAAEMLTLTTPVLEGFAATPRRFTPTNASVGRRCRPRNVSRRTRSDVLRMLVGADSGRMPYLPRRGPRR